MEIFENWGYGANPDIDDEIYLVVLLATWLSGRVFGRSFTIVRSENFVMAVEMAQGKKYSLDVPYQHGPTIIWESSNRPVSGKNL